MEQDYRPSKDLRDALVIISSTTTALGTNLTLTDSALTEGDDYWNNMAVVILSGNSIGQIRRISGFVQATGTITVDTAFSTQIAIGTQYDILGQYAGPGGGGDATAANQVLILADTNAILLDTAEIGAAGAGLTAVAQASVCLEARLAELDAANLPTDVANVKTDTAAILINTMTATDKGVRQVFEKTITANANSGANILGTITTQACVIESIIIHANAALPADTTCAVTGAVGVVTFIDAGMAIAATLNAADTQVSWTSGGSGGAVRLAATKTIITTLADGGANPTNLTFIITYYSSSANGGTIS